MIRIRNLKLGLDEPESMLADKASRAVRSRVSDVKIIKRSLDARHKNDIHYLYTVEAAVKDEASALAHCKDASPAAHTDYTVPVPAAMPAQRPVIVGFGPAGMFAGLILAEAGLRPIILERGDDAETRTEKVRAMRTAGILDPESNIQFGEGGAGAFSDGKLTTGVKNPRIPFVLQTLVHAGAPQEILYDAKPHIGTDLLPGICANIRRRITGLGGEVRFGSRMDALRHDGGHVTGLDTQHASIDCSAVILACGHSARDTFRILADLPMVIAPKAFAMGVRIEHPQADIDRAQYGATAGHPNLPPADYSLACELPNGRRCYTFCMCPGGEVMPAASEPGRVCVNGGSPWKRDLENANAAVLAAISPEDFPFEGILGGMLWQQALEQRAFEAAGGGYRAPMQTVGEFLTGHAVRGGAVRPSYQPGVAECDLRSVLPDILADTIAGALPRFGLRLHGFDRGDALLTGPEARSSSPIRMERGTDLQAVGLRGLYPCGEGAGWAGGIMSAALDGIRCAEALIAAL